MNRSSGRIANPQVMASVSTRLAFTGSELLGKEVDGDTWLTPRFILQELGKFELDPCAADGTPHWVAPLSFQKRDDGLRQSWGKLRVFMNPPFSNTAPWLEKHSAHGIGISLVPASVESKVWRSHVWPKGKATAILLLHGRTRFCNPDGSTTTGRPLRSIALIAWDYNSAVSLQTASLAGIFLTEWGQR